MAYFSESIYWKRKTESERWERGKKFHKTAKDYYCLNEKVECCKMEGGM
jgi:hypothetical protein